MRTPSQQPRHAYTLIELLIVIIMMGIGGALVIPTIDGAEVLRSQAAVRTLVSDIMYAQSDAIASQEPRAIVFDKDTNSYTLVAVPGALIDVDNNTLYDPFSRGNDYVVTFQGGQFGSANIWEVEFDTDDDQILIFDEFGAPVRAPGSVEPTTGGYIYMQDPNYWFHINIEGMTGQVWTEKFHKAVWSPS